MKTKPDHFNNPMDQACIYRHTGSRPTQGMASLRVSLAFIFFHHKNNLLNEFSGDSLVKNNLGTIPSIHTLDSEINVRVRLLILGFFSVATYLLKGYEF